MGGGWNISVIYTSFAVYSYVLCQVYLGQDVDVVTQLLFFRSLPATLTNHKVKRQCDYPHHVIYNSGMKGGLLCTFRAVL